MEQNVLNHAHLDIGIIRIMYANNVTLHA
jgi:hypothetical protein